MRVALRLFGASPLSVQTGIEKYGNSFIIIKLVGWLWAMLECSGLSDTFSAATGL
jgi:hypothetical protein